MESRHVSFLASVCDRMQGVFPTREAYLIKLQCLEFLLENPLHKLDGLVDHIVDLSVQVN